MEQRRRPEEIVRGLSTTSAKIRALAQAGYDRTEISEQLGIRYQHVRKVLLDAGITGGLRRQVEAEREPVTVDATPPPREATSSDVLLRAGFLFLGEWTQVSTAIKLEAKAPDEPGVYAFVADDVVVYVGLTANGLRARLDQYRLGYKGQKTNARVNGLISKALSHGQQVKILVATPAPLEWHGLPVNTAAGLEAGLIQMIRPPWNIVVLSTSAGSIRDARQAGYCAGTRHAGPSPIFTTFVMNVSFESSRSPTCAVTSQQPGVVKIK